MVIMPESLPRATVPIAWIPALLASETLGDQKRLGGRAIPSDAIFSRLLEIIDDRGGRITSTALAKKNWVFALTLTRPASRSSATPEH